MCKIFGILALACLLVSAHAQQNGNFLKRRAEGWFWYETEPEPEPEKPVKPKPEDEKSKRKVPP